MFQANVFAVLFVLLGISKASANDYWRLAHNMTGERMDHRSTFIDGMNTVVITGGCSAAIDTFFASNASIIHRGDMTTTRCFHSADLLSDGLVLIEGGPVGFNSRDGNGCVADLYDPRSGMVNKTVRMVECRTRHTSSIIHTNHSTKVLIAGGNWEGISASGEVFDTRKKTFHPVNNSMPQPREYHTSTTLPNEHVIIAGGCVNDGTCMDTLLLYNSRLNHFFPLSARLSNQRAFHTATYIPSIESIIFVSSGTFDLFDVPTLTFVANGTTLENRQDHTATLLLDGRVLFTGGSHNYGLTSCEIYDPLTNKFMPAANMSFGRYWHTASLIPTTGEVLVCGGRNLQGLFNSCEIYSP
jgi:hypothetical protein